MRASSALAGDIFMPICERASDRSYEVDFSLFKQLAPNHQPQVTIEKAVIGLSEGLSGINFIDPDFRKSNTLIRLNTLRGHCQSGRLDKDLYWVK